MRGLWHLHKPGRWTRSQRDLVLRLAFLVALRWPPTSGADHLDGSLCSIGTPREQKLPARQPLSISFGPRPPDNPSNTRVSGMPEGSHVVYAECLHDGTPQYDATWHLDEKAPRDVLVLDLPPLPPGFFTVGILLLRGTARSAGRAAGSENEERDLLAMRKIQKSPFSTHISTHTESENTQTTIEFECSSVRFDYAPAAAGDACDGSEEDITLTSIASIDRATQVMHVAARWDGPMSVALYARSHGETEALEEFSKEVLLHLSRSRNQAMSIEILSGCCDKRPGSASGDVEPSQEGEQAESCLNTFDFPINRLRSSAVQRARTHRVLPLDADFLPSHKAHDLLKQAYGYHNSNSAQWGKNFLVLPCFLTKDDALWPSAASLKVDAKRGLWLEMGEPLTKSRLREAYGASEVYPPGAPFALHTHGASNYPLWMAMNASMHGNDPTYAVKYNLWYEPYGVVNKSSWPGVAGRGMFDARFVGYGGDKVSWVHEAALHGYNFRVHSEVFAVHMPENALQTCDALLPGFCQVVNQTTRTWGARGGGHQEVGRHIRYQFLDHIMSTIPSPKPSTRSVCFVKPSSLYQKLSRRELADLFFGPGRLSPGRKWNAQGGIFLCARDSCDFVHPDLVIFTTLFLYPGALVDVELVPSSTKASNHIELQTRMWEQVMQRWCLQALPLTGSLRTIRPRDDMRQGHVLLFDRFQLLGMWNETQVQHFTEEAIGYLLPTSYCHAHCFKGDQSGQEPQSDSIALQLSLDSRCGGYFSLCPSVSGRRGKEVFSLFTHVAGTPDERHFVRCTIITINAGIEEVRRNVLLEYVRTE